MSYGFPPQGSLPYSSFPPQEVPPPSYSDNTVGRLIAWIVIIITVVAISWTNWRESKLPDESSLSTHPGVQLEVAAKYDLAAGSLLGNAAQSAASGKTLIAQLDAAAEAPADKLGVVTVVAEMEGKGAALARLDTLTPTLPTTLQTQAQTLRAIYAKGDSSALSADQRDGLTKSLGWFGRLALTFGKSSDDPQRKLIFRTANLVTRIIFAAVSGGVLALIVGLVLCIILMVRLADGKLLLHYHPLPARGGVFLEAFAIYVAGLGSASFIIRHLPHALRHSLTTQISLMLAPTILAIFWPLLRGIGKGDWRRAIGWHTGNGIVYEMLLGVAGYIAGLPIMALGMIITLVLVKISHAHPSHPIDHMLGVSPAMTILVLMLAGVYAPITEETMFRGAFFHSLRARHRWLLSAIVSSFIFAAIHPQGWTVVPTLMAIAIVFAGIREWRGTIFSSATAHCVHNTMLVLLVTLMMQ